MRERKLEGWGDLLLAAYKGRKSAVVTLLEKKADPNETDNLGRTALIHAAAQGHADVVQELLAAGTDALYSPSTDGRSALHWAAFYGHRSAPPRGPHMPRACARAGSPRPPHAATRVARADRAPPRRCDRADDAATCCRPPGATSTRPTTRGTRPRCLPCLAAPTSSYTATRTQPPLRS